MSTPENPVQHKGSRAQALREFVREQTTKYEAGEIPEIPSREELRIRFGYTRPSAVDRDLRSSGRSGRFYQRAKNLRDVVTQEIEDLRAGRIDRLSSFAELSAQFGYKHPASTAGTLSTTGLLQARKLAEREIKYSFPPSNELAWIIGVLAGGGVIDKSTGISLSSYTLDLLERFRSRGERIFKIAAREGVEHKTFRGRIAERPIVRFNNTRLVKILGDLTREEWPNTVMSTHNWIWEQEKYGWSFLEGFFDKRGGMHGPYTLLLSTSSKSSANFLAELMVRLGLRNPKIIRDCKTKEGIAGVALYNLADIKIFAEYIHPVSRGKAERLEQFRERELHKHTTEEQVIGEWIKARDLLRHPPTWSDIRRLNREGILLCSTKVFERRFGAGSFRKARENLEKIIEEQRGRLRISPD